jgi:Tol biopolymer transport system component
MYRSAVVGVAAWLALLAGISSIAVPNLGLAAEVIYFSRAEAKSTPTQLKLSIYSMAADGSNQKQITKAEDADVDPAVSADGKRIVFTAVKLDEGRPTTSIVVMNADGSERKTLVQDEGSILFAPVWSPDGKRIAYSKVLFGNEPPEMSLHVMNADGSDRKEVGDGVSPQWSPDGGRIAYAIMARDGDRLPQLHIMDADGKNSKQMVEGTAMMAVWSPDGKRIAYMADGGGQPDLFIMEADGSGKKQLTRTEEFETGLQWLSDSKRIVFSRMPRRSGDRDRGASGTEIYSIGADGADEKQLTKNDVIDATAGGSLFFMMTRATKAEEAKKSDQ